jgi:hypothetical protein
MKTILIFSSAVFLLVSAILNSKADGGFDLRTLNLRGVEKNRSRCIQFPRADSFRVF